MSHYMPAPATIFKPLTDKQLDTLIDKAIDAARKSTKVTGTWSLGFMADELDMLNDAITEWRHRNNLLILMSDSIRP